MAEKGHRVFAGYRNNPSPGISEVAEQYTGCTLIQLDITNEAMAERAAQQASDDGGLLDAVVLVAGILPDSDRRLLITDAVIPDMRAVLETNVTGTAIVIKHFHKLVKDGGMFIIITSEAGSMTNINTMYPEYAISKAAQNKLAAIFAKTVTNYRVYAVHPGRMNTVMGKTNAQIEPEISADGIYRILTGEKTVAPEHGWFINYLGEPMEI
jgi:NAD(P)-dependent dehydrogenase (short-subunit alcohol dehydrogenase family)